MILSSVMMYFVLGITTLRSYADRYRLDERLMYKVSLVKRYFYQKHVLFIRCSGGETALVPSQPEQCKNEYFNREPQAELIADFISWDPQQCFSCIKLDLHSNVNAACGQRRVCVLYSTPRSQQTWTVPTTVGQTAGESPNTHVCRSMWASITQAVSAVYLTMKRPRTPALKWVQCQRENTENYWTVSNVDNGCQMLVWL